MAAKHNILKTSTEALPARDPADAAIKELDSMCRELVETVHSLQDAERATHRNERIIGRLEERVYTMTDAIHARQRRLYLDVGLNINISHTQDGLPIRANKVRKITLWGSVG